MQAYGDLGAHKRRENNPNEGSDDIIAILCNKGFLSHTEYNSCSLSNELTFLKAHGNQVPFIIIPLLPS